jgi:hypothetical protein
MTGHPAGFVAGAAYHAAIGLLLINTAWECPAADTNAAGITPEIRSFTEPGLL